MKKQMWLKMLMLALCAAFVLTGLIACTPDEPGDEDDIPPEDALILMDPDTRIGIYTVVRPDIVEARVSDAASALRMRLENYYNAEDWGITTDWEKNPDPAEIAARYEILIGETNRPESAQVLSELNEGEYAIRVVNNKLVIIGSDDRRTAMAVNYFMDTYLSEGAPAVPKTLNVLTAGTSSTQSTENGPIIVNTQYTTQDVVIADIYLSDEEYGVDPTGISDSTTAIQNALNDCHRNGGGTVFLPAGKYRITKNITVPAFVTLRGDWQDPDEGNEYGTIILADVKSKESQQEGLFTLSGSAGVYGMTVYYPNQSIDDPKPYPATFFVCENSTQGIMAATIKNVTVVNGYEGIRARVSPAHEQLTVENFKATCLSVGLFLTNSSDVGTCSNITVRPTYWTAFAEAMKYPVPDEAKVKAYTRANAAGFMIGDLEWTEFIHITVTDCKYGIHIIDGSRISFAGSFYDTVVVDCDVALQADDMDTRWGMQISNSYLVGSEYAIVNNSSALIKTAGTTAKGGLKGTVLVDTDNLEKYNIDTGATYKKPVEKLYMDATLDKTGATDVSAKLQALLDEAGKTGGVVYLPAGHYRLDNPLSVPAGVELRGASSIPNRDQRGLSAGTVLRCYYGDDEDSRVTDQAFITLSGNYAGLNGIRIIYPENSNLTSNINTTYTIRGKAKGVYFVNGAISASAYGVDFRGCDEHFIKKITTCCYYNTFIVGGKGGSISGCLQNGTLMYRTSTAGLVDWPTDESKIWAELFDPITRQKCQYIIVDGATDQLVYNTFIYGGSNMIVNRNSQNTLCVNIGSDNLGDTSAQLVLEGGSFTGINVLRYNGVSCEYTKGTKVRLYARLAINEKREETLIVD